VVLIPPALDAFQLCPMPYTPQHNALAQAPGNSSKRREFVTVSINEVSISGYHDALTSTTFLSG
jgi:hypothetical protein